MHGLAWWTRYRTTEINELLTEPVDARSTIPVEGSAVTFAIYAGQSAARTTVLRVIDAAALKGDLKGELWSRLLDGRATLLAKVHGLSEYDLRRPMTPTGTNLLGLVKHLAGEEYGYLGEVFGRPSVIRPTWFRDDAATEIDMWATPDEPSSYIVEVYRQAASHADETIRLLDLDSPGAVRHWPGNQRTSLGSMLVLMVGETAQHAGHADILRELIDGSAGASIDGGNDRLTAAQEAADHLH